MLPSNHGAYVHPEEPLVRLGVDIDGVFWVCGKPAPPSGKLGVTRSFRRANKVQFKKIARQPAGSLVPFRWADWSIGAWGLRLDLYDKSYVSWSAPFPAEATAGHRVTINQLLTMPVAYWSLESVAFPE